MLKKTLKKEKSLLAVWSSISLSLECYLFSQVSNIFLHSGKQNYILVSKALHGDSLVGTARINNIKTAVRNDEVYFFFWRCFLWTSLVGKIFFSTCKANFFLCMSINKSCFFIIIVSTYNLLLHIKTVSLLELLVNSPLKKLKCSAL